MYSLIEKTFKMTNHINILHKKTDCQAFHFFESG